MREREPDINNKTQRLAWPGLPQIYCLAFHVKMSLSRSLLLLLHRMELLAIMKYRNDLNYHLQLNWKFATSTF